LNSVLNIKIGTINEGVTPIAVLKEESVSVIQRNYFNIFIISIVYKTFLVSILLLSIKSNTILKIFAFNEGIKLLF
jgi:hypothetical protein